MLNGSLPYRQLRKYKPFVADFRLCSLPYRQLRNALVSCLLVWAGSLPYRQLRKDRIPLSG